MRTDYAALIEAACQQIDSGVEHACCRTDHCNEMGGCPRCFRAVMRGAIDIARIDVFAESGIIRLTLTAGCGEATPCAVSFRGVPTTIHR